MSALVPDQHSQPAHDTDAAIPPAGSARVHILQDGYAREDDTGERVGSTVTLIVDSDVTVVVDPGMSRRGRSAGAQPRAPHLAVTDVVFSHHHPDHTVNAALFPAARSTLRAVYDGDLWISREAEGTGSTRVRLTPAPTDQDLISASTTDGVSSALTPGGAGSPACVQPRPAGLRAAGAHTGIASVIIPGHALASSRTRKRRASRANRADRQLHAA